MIVGEEEIEGQMERQLITGIAHDRNEAKVTNYFASMVTQDKDKK